MDRKFKAHPSSLSKIMGSIGITEIQESELMELHTRKYDPKAKPLTAKMEERLAELIDKRDNPKLSQTCISHLMEWYANEPQSIHSKYIDKGNMCENDCIDFMAQVLEFGIASKNTQTFETEHMIGTPDVIMKDCIVDVKCPWDVMSLQSNASGMNYDYKWQLLGYMCLTKKTRAILFYGLMDTDESINYGQEVIYSHLPDEQRWIAYEITANVSELIEMEQRINERVDLCRAWLENYDLTIKSKMGKINKAQN